MTLLLLSFQMLLSHLVDCCQFENGSMIYSAGGRYSTNITECIYPSSEQEIIGLINMVQQTNSSIRATGKSHSKSGVNMMEENTEIDKQLFMINMSVNMKNIIELNTDENFITFEAGLGVYELLQYLEINNLTLSHWSGGPLMVNFVGAMLTGTHQMGSKKHMLTLVASNVINLRMITANETIIEANNTFNKDIFDAARISFGALGIITQITVRTGPIFYATRYATTVFHDVDNMEIIRQIIENNVTHDLTYYDNVYHRYSFFEYYIRAINKVIIHINGTNETNINPNCWDSAADIDQQRYLQSVSFPSSNNDNVDSMVCTDIIYKAVLGNPPSPSNFEPEFAFFQPIEYEMFVDAAIWKEALIGVFEWVFAQRNEKTDLWIDTERFYNEFDGDITMEWRFVAMDNDIWLSPSYHGDIFQIGMHFHGENSLNINDGWTFGIHDYLRDNFGTVTYHLGKQSLSNYCDLQESYPKLEDFKNLRDELDPNGIFLNKFIRDKLGLCSLDEMKDCCCTNSTCKSYSDDIKSDDGYVNVMMITIIGGGVVLLIIGFILIIYLYKKHCRSGQEEKLQQNNTNYKAIEQVTY